MNHDREDWQKDLARCPLKPGEVRNRFGQKMRQIDVDFYLACRTASVKKLKEMLERGETRMRLGTTILEMIIILFIRRL